MPKCPICGEGVRSDLNGNCVCNDGCGYRGPVDGQRVLTGTADFDSRTYRRCGYSYFNCDEDFTTIGGVDAAAALTDLLDDLPMNLPLRLTMRIEPVHGEGDDG